MLVNAVESYLSVRRACGFNLHIPGQSLTKFCRLLRGERETARVLANRHRVVRIGAIDLSARPPPRPGDSLRPVRRAEDQSHELPPAVFGSTKRPRRTPYIFSPDEIVRLVHAAAQSSHPFRRQTYRTLFALLACTGLRVSEAIRLRLEDITPDGMLIWHSKFRKSRLVPLHETRGRDSSGISNTASPMPPSITTYSCHCEESRCSMMMLKEYLGLPQTGSAYSGDSVIPHPTHCATPSRCGPWRPRLMAASASQSIWWRSRPISATV